MQGLDLPVMPRAGLQLPLGTYAGLEGRAASTATVEGLSPMCSLSSLPPSPMDVVWASREDSGGGGGGGCSGGGAAAMATNREGLDQGRAIMSFPEGGS